MKRRKFITHLETHGCHLYREGGKHTLYYNSANKQVASVPRHKETSEFTAYAICQALRVPRPK
jgi:predicted RNA binding protein YcfA (HicA-like mRNA interferase family)